MLAYTDRGLVMRHLQDRFPLATRIVTWSDPTAFRLVLSVLYGETTYRVQVDPRHWGDGVDQLVDKVEVPSYWMAL